MTNNTQRKLAQSVGISEAHLSYIINHEKRRPSWKVAKRLAMATGTTPELWLEGTPELIKRVIQKGKQ